MTSVQFASVMPFLSERCCLQRWS